MDHTSGGASSYLNDIVTSVKSTACLICPDDDYVDPYILIFILVYISIVSIVFLQVPAVS